MSQVKKEKVDKKEQEKKQTENKDTLERTKEKQSLKISKNKYLTWVLLIVGVLVILTIAALIGLKFHGDYNTKKSQETSIKKEVTPRENELQTTTSSKPLTKEELIAQAFYYPNSTKVPVSSELYCVQLLLYSNDPAVTVYQYYEDLIELNNWETGPVGMQTGDKAGFFYIYQDDFNVDLNINTEEGNKNGSTKIEVNVSCKNDDLITSTFNRPSVEQQPTPPSDNQESQTITQKEYILPFSNSRAVIRDDLLELTPWELKVARNEIYARHGRSFVHQDLSCYFKKLSWYEIDPNYTEKKLSTLETSNAVFILNYEKEVNSPLVNKDTGCK